MTTDPNAPYKALVRLKDGSKEKYTINRNAGTVEDAVKCLMTEIPNIQTGVVLVPLVEHFVEPDAA